MSRSWISEWVCTTLTQYSAHDARRTTLASIQLSVKFHSTEEKPVERPSEANYTFSRSKNAAMRGKSVPHNRLLSVHLTFHVSFEDKNKSRTGWGPQVVCDDEKYFPRLPKTTKTEKGRRQAEKEANCPTAFSSPCLVRRSCGTRWCFRAKELLIPPNLLKLIRTTVWPPSCKSLPSIYGKGEWGEEKARGDSARKHRKEGNGLLIPIRTIMGIPAGDLFISCFWWN